MLVAGIETSCDESSFALVRDDRILANVVSSQVKLHSEYGGVVPELATREHLRNLLPVAREALSRISIDELDVVAVTQGPGLPPALNIGFVFAQALSFALGKPLIGINHHEAHLYSPWIHEDICELARFEPNVSLIVSGGHTLLIHVAAPLEHRILGGTVDDAAGECFDKTAKLIGLPYPGGPEMDRLASRGNPRMYPFPKPMVHDSNDDFSFSGLKTSVRYFLRDHPDVFNDERKLFDLCASVQASIVEVLVTKTMRAARRLGVKCVTASGGVTCNSALRAGLESACKAAHLNLRLAERKYCTDNAAMIASLAAYKVRHGVEPLGSGAEIRPGWTI
jgi:N6-L-threonylcarbamoyladenine synthase